MIETTRLLEDDSMNLLKAFLGETLSYFEAYIMFEGPDQIYKTVRIGTDSHSALITNTHQRIPLGAQGVLEEVSVLALRQDHGEELWCPPHKEISRKVGMNLHIDDIYLVVDTIELTMGNIPVNKLKYTQAIVFREGGRLIAFDRDIWFDEYITVREGFDIDTLVRDASGDWHEEPPYGYRFTRDVISLAMGGIRV